MALILPLPLLSTAERNPASCLSSSMAEAGTVAIEEMICLEILLCCNHRGEAVHLMHKFSIKYNLLIRRVLCCTVRRTGRETGKYHCGEKRKDQPEANCISGIHYRRYFNKYKKGI